LFRALAQGCGIDEAFLGQELDVFPILVAEAAELRHGEVERRKYPYFDQLFVDSGDLDGLGVAVRAFVEEAVVVVPVEIHEARAPVRIPVRDLDVFVDQDLLRESGVDVFGHPRPGEIVERGASRDVHANGEHVRPRSLQGLLDLAEDLVERLLVFAVAGARFHGERLRFLAMGRNREGRIGDCFSHISKASGVETPGCRLSASRRYFSRSNPLALASMTASPPMKNRGPCDAQTSASAFPDAARSRSFSS